MTEKKKIHVLISREGFEEIEDMKDKLGVREEPRKTYEEYLEEQKRNPTMAYHG